MQSDPPVVTVQSLRATSPLDGVTESSESAAPARRSLTVFGINYAPEPSGNAPYTTGLAEHLARLEWDVTVVTGYPHYPAWKRQSAQKRTRLSGVAVTRTRHSVPRSSSAAQRGFFELTSLLGALPEALKKRRTDVVLGVVPNLSGAVLALIAATRNRVPSVIWYQDLMGSAAQQSGTSGGGHVAGLVEWIETSLAKRADLLMIVAEGFRPYFEGVGIDTSTIVRVRNWNLLPRRSLGRDETRDSFGIDRNAKVALHSGNMGMKQGLEVILETADRAPEFTFILQGDGNARNELESSCRGRRLTNVRFLPSLPSQDLANLLAAADVLLVTQREAVSTMALPSKLASYAGAGVPIVASVNAESETARELEERGLEERGLGSVVAPGDPEELALAIRRAAADLVTTQEVDVSSQPSATASVLAKTPLEGIVEAIDDAVTSDS